MRGQESSDLPISSALPNIGHRLTSSDRPPTVIGHPATTKEPAVALPPGLLCRDLDHRLAAQQLLGLHVHGHRHIEAEGREAVREIVAAGIGVGFVSEAEFGHDDRIARYRLEGVTPSMNENVVCLQQRRDVRVIRTFMQLARQTVGTGSGEAIS